MKSFFLGTGLLLSLNAYSYTGEYRVGLFHDATVDYNKSTHIIVVGSAVKEDSDQFFQSGMSRAYKYKELYPNQQVVVISSPEVVDRNDEKVFADYQLNVIKFVNNTLEQDKLVDEMMAFNRIRSIDFFGHSSPWGFKLGKKDAAFDPSSIVSRLSNLKSHMLPYSYITMSSCNSGFNLAPKLSEILGVPVSGTLTSGLFERVESDGHWYKEADWTPGNYVEVNKVSFTENIMCSLTGACTRMKTSRSSYSSYWGDFTEGLSFPKFFCKFENIDHKCETGMAMALMTFPSVRAIKFTSTTEDFKQVAFDWLCQTSKDHTVFDKCVAGINQAIKNGDLVYKSHTAPEIVCDFNSCHATVICKNKVIIGSGPRAHSCKLKAETSEKPTTIANEFIHFINGFELIKK